MTHEEILERLDRLAGGDDFNDPATLAAELLYLSREAHNIAYPTSPKEEQV